MNKFKKGDVVKSIMSDLTLTARKTTMNLIDKTLKIFHLIEPEDTRQIAPIEIVAESAIVAIKLTDSHGELAKVEDWITEAFEPYLLHRAFDRYMQEIRAKLKTKRSEMKLIATI